jgi:hypothetical protein
MSESARTHVYATEQLYSCAERAPLYLRDFTPAEIWAVQSFLLRFAELEAQATQRAIDREKRERGVGNAHGNK